MQRFVIYTSLTISLFNISTPVFSQEFNEENDLDLLYGDDEMVSIATGMSQPVTVAPSTATVITADDIKAMGAMTIDQVLERVPGVHVQPSTLNRLDPVYTFRGIYTGFNPQVLFMLNGHRISSQLFTGGLLQSAYINVQNISRIEIVRGPGSAVYGADAFAGVINIITKSKNDLDGLNIGVRGGSLDTKNTWLQYGADVFKNWDLSANFEYAKQDADTSRVVDGDLQSLMDLAPPDGFGTSASLAPTYLDRRYESLSYNLHLTNDNWKFGVDGWNQRDKGVGAGASQAIDHEGHDDTDHMLLTAEYNTKSLANNWDFTGKLSYQMLESQTQFNIFRQARLL